MSSALNNASGDGSAAGFVAAAIGCRSMAGGAGIPGVARPYAVDIVLPSRAVGCDSAPGLMACVACAFGAAARDGCLLADRKHLAPA